MKFIQFTKDLFVRVETIFFFIYIAISTAGLAFAFSLMTPINFLPLFFTFFLIVFSFFMLVSYRYWIPEVKNDEFARLRDINNMTMDGYINWQLSLYDIEEIEKQDKERLIKLKNTIGEMYDRDVAKYNELLQQKQNGGK